MTLEHVVVDNPLPLNGQVRHLGHRSLPSSGFPSHSYIDQGLREDEERGELQADFPSWDLSLRIRGLAR